MSRLALLARPHWEPFLHLPGFNRLPSAALSAADGFFDYVALHGLADPDAHDIAAWAKAEAPGEAGALLDELAIALEICIPSFAQRVHEAARLARRNAREEMKTAVAVGACLPIAAASWDPLAPPSRKPPRPRAVSVEPRDLPLEMQENLRRMALGLPKNEVIVCASISRRLREKVCQLVWSAREEGLEPEINDATVGRYQSDVEGRSAKGKNGLRWATVRASVEEIHRYARYAGLPSDIRKPISQRLAVLRRREMAQKALKFAALAATANTTLSVLDQADELLERAVGEIKAEKRHRLRNAACILGLYPIAPLRNASAALVFDRTLFWLNGAWVIHTPIQKTRSHNPEPFVMELEPQHGKFIDAVILGDAEERHLAELREEVLAQQRLLFVLPDGKPTAQTYVPRIYKVLTGNSFTTTRTMIHTECMTAHGLAGRNMAMAACHQTSTRIAEKYEADAVAFAAMARRQATASERRVRYGLAAELGDL